VLNEQMKNEAMGLPVHDMGNLPNLLHHAILCFKTPLPCLVMGQA
jgi:hypothetical protein